MHVSHVIEMVCRSHDTGPIVRTDCHHVVEYLGRNLEPQRGFIHIVCPTHSFSVLSLHFPDGRYVDDSVIDYILAIVT